MNAKSKKTLKAAALAAGLIAVLLPTGCASTQPELGVTNPAAAQPAPGSAVVAPPTVD